MSADRITSARLAFRRLHEQGCFVMPNPWDVGSALYLQRLGFAALATTSAGFAFSQGLPDSDIAVSRERTLAHFREMAEALDVPLNADFASGYGVHPDALAESVTACVATGVSGLSVEDSTSDRPRGLVDFELSVERIRAARSAIDATKADVLLTARAECYLVGHADPLNESLRRLRAYAAAGADVLYSPGPHKPEEIRELVQAVSPKPFNLLVGRNIGLSVADIAALGVRRISVGGALARAAWTGFIRAAQTLRTQGSFEGLADLVSFANINSFLATDFEARLKRGV
jgi:2-methylisocitrate lyase-like PEP mutase family enzyme